LEPVPEGREQRAGAGVFLRQGEPAAPSAWNSADLRHFHVPAPQPVTIHAQLADWGRAAGMATVCDRAANMILIRQGALEDPPVAAGSHLDTQPHGGRFDGVSGVLAALEVAETLNDAGIVTRAPYAVVNFTNEEGVRFVPGLLGSAWFSGKLSDDALVDCQTADGTGFLEEARARNLSGVLRQGDLPLGAFFELHIEQGPVLEREGCAVGIVDGVQGLRWLDVNITGTDAHAGTTPLSERRDALLCAARMIVALHEVGRDGGVDARVSVGRLKTATDGPSTVAGDAQLVVDVRHPDAAVLDALTSRCAKVCGEIAVTAGCEAVIHERIAIAPVAFDGHLVGALETAAADLGLAYRHMTSGALHDASNLAAVAPTAMVFVPCRGGVSHNVAEYASPQDLEAGANVLLHAVLARAGIASASQG
ncbi:MAG: M20 family metallo-hydrolase, partial [Pseudomonadota bacterium]